MNTNTILLIALGVVFVLSAVGIWLANYQGQKSSNPPAEDHDYEEDEVIHEEDDVEEDKKVRED